jgi:hypothetical protein
MMIACPDAGEHKGRMKNESALTEGENSGLKVRLEKVETIRYMFTRTSRSPFPEVE